MTGRKGSRFIFFLPETVARKATRTYGARNRVSSLSFPDSRGSQTWTYTADGLPATITTYNGLNNTDPVINAYAYNRRRQLAGEGTKRFQVHFLPP